MQPAFRRRWPADGAGVTAADGRRRRMGRDTNRAEGCPTAADAERLTLHVQLLVSFASARAPVGFRRTPDVDLKRAVARPISGSRPRGPSL